MEYFIRYSNSPSHIQEVYNFLDRIYQLYNHTSKKLTLIDAHYVMCYNSKKELVGTAYIQFNNKEFHVEKLLGIDILDILPEHEKSDLAEAGRLAICDRESYAARKKILFAICYGHSHFLKQHQIPNWYSLSSNTALKALQKIGYATQILPVVVKEERMKQLQELSPTYFHPENFPKLILFNTAQNIEILSQQVDLVSKVHFLTDTIGETNANS